NENKPYYQFIKERLAGDELDNPTSDRLTATGFVRLGPRVLDRDLENPNYRLDYMDDMVRNTFQSFQGLTVNCARCHDHKFDPITRRDYYRSLAIFNTYVEYDYPLVSQEEWNKYEAAADALNAKIKALNQEIGKIEAPYKKALFQNMLAKLPPDIQEAFKTPEDKRTPGRPRRVAVAGSPPRPEHTKASPCGCAARAGLDRRGTTPPPLGAHLPRWSRGQLVNLDS